MPQRDTSTDHGDKSAPKGIDSPGTFGPINSRPTKPADGWPTDTPSNCNADSFEYPPSKE